jgi:signal transduction histidine kinase
MKRPSPSLRASVLIAVMAVVLSPLAFVLISNFLESAFSGRALERTAHDAEELAFILHHASAELNSKAEAERFAHHRNQRVRVLGPGGAVEVDVDLLTGDRAPFTTLGDLFYGPHRRRVLERLSSGPLPGQRADVARAHLQGTESGCQHSTEGNLDYCATAVRIDADRVVLVEGISRRALQALYESRRQLTKLTLLVLALGLVLWWWLGLRIVRPIQSLRRELLTRAAAAVPRADLDAGRRDELGALASSFNALLTALAERDRANETFLADLAHEFKNPVAAVRAAAEQLSDGGAKDPARAQRLADALMNSSVRLDAMVTQFLELARAESGLPNEAREDVDVAALLRGLVDVLRKDVRYPEVRVDLACPNGPLPVHGVPQRLEAAFRNLLDNGASFAGAKGSVRVDATVADGLLDVAIQDSGPGISDSDLPRIFDRFFTTRGDRHGTGLGLALTRAVLEAHGGHIRAEAPLGSGARFVIRLPLVG